MNEKAKFMESFGLEGFEWFDLTGISEMDDDRRAVVRLVALGHADRYEGIHAEVVSKTNGRIAGKTFRFSDYLTLSEDQPRPAAKRVGFKAPKVEGNCGWEWYILVPASTWPLCHAVERWIHLFT